MRGVRLAVLVLLAGVEQPSQAFWAARCEPRAQALGDYLLAQASGDEGEQARQRLQNRARTSTDPLITVLALHMPCLQPGCRNVEAAQWSRLEPANTLAWLTLGGAGNERYVLDQLIARARYLRGYQSEVAALLQGVPAEGAGLRSPWALASLHRLAASCGQGRGDAGQAERCDEVAELLWRDGGATERLAAMRRAVRAGAVAARVACMPPRLSAWAAVAA